MEKDILTEGKKKKKVKKNGGKRGGSKIRKKRKRIPEICSSGQKAGHVDPRVDNSVQLFHMHYMAKFDFVIHKFFFFFNQLLQSGSTSCL